MAESRVTVISVEGECGVHMMGKSYQNKFHCEETLRKSTTHWYAPFSEYLSKGIIPPAMTYEQRKRVSSHKLKVSNGRTHSSTESVQTGSLGGVLWSTR